MKVKNIMIYTGYVESNSWGNLAFTHITGFNSVEEMIINLAKAMKRGFKC